MTRLDHVARAWIGTPFRHQGRAAHGLDCVGLVVLACAAVGRPVDDVTSYGRDPHAGLLEQHLGAALRRVAREPRPGDVVACAFPAVVRHVGIVGEHPLGGLSLIHTWSRVGRVVEHVFDAQWRRRVRGVYEVKP